MFQGFAKVQQFDHIRSWGKKQGFKQRKIYISYSGAQISSSFMGDYQHKHPKLLLLMLTTMYYRRVLQGKKSSKNYQTIDHSSLEHCNLVIRDHSVGHEQPLPQCGLVQSKWSKAITIYESFVTLKLCTNVWQEKVRCHMRICL